MSTTTTEEATPQRCARCRGDLAAWTMRRGVEVFCSWFCWHLADRQADPIVAEVERATG